MFTFIDIAKSKFENISTMSIKSFPKKPASLLNKQQAMYATGILWRMPAIKSQVNMNWVLSVLVFKAFPGHFPRHTIMVFSRYFSVLLVCWCTRFSWVKSFGNSSCGSQGSLVLVLTHVLQKVRPTDNRQLPKPWFQEKKGRNFHKNRT